MATCARHDRILKSLPVGRVATEFRNHLDDDALALCTTLPLTASAFAQKPTFTVGWSVYAGWTPYYYMNKVGHPAQVGRQVRHRHQGPALRLRAVAGRLRREEHRRLHHDQHGGARHARRLRRADHRDPDRRLLQRQRRPAGAQRTCSSKTSPGKKMLLVREDRLRIPVRSRHDPERPARPDQARAAHQHLRFRHRDRLHRRHLASAVVTWKPMVSQISEAEGRHVALQFLADSRRNSWT